MDEPRKGRSRSKLTLLLATPLAAVAIWASVAAAGGSGTPDSSRGGRGQARQEGAEAEDAARPGPRTRRTGLPVQPRRRIRRQRLTSGLRGRPTGGPRRRPSPHRSG